ncbi:hypothetical protein [Secundilactobacillus yichangensis]|uniref:hypothetical protein n=1 Tax=Secundilactobacillus yichangensis TaxID=2799580 RepID=UPI00194551D5|nr:hypothetical protein [Secundilactobacillus yichangensis]
MTDTLKKINLFLIYILLVLQLDIFFVIPMPDVFYKLESYTSKYLSIAIVVLIIVINLGKLPQFLHTSKIYGVTSCLILLFTTILLFYSKTLYDQSFSSSVTSAHQFYLLLLFFALYLVNPSKEMLFKIAKATIVFSTIASIILIFQSVLYLKNLTFLAQNITAVTIQSPSFLFGLPRISEAADFVSFSIFIQSYLVATNKVKIRSIIFWTLTNFLYIIFIAQTRMYMIVDIVIVLLALVSLLNRKNIQFGIIIGLLALTISAFAIHPIIDQFVNGTRSISYFVRIQALKFYYNEIPAKSFFGIGFPNGSQDLVLHGGILNTLGYQYYLDDLGVFGFYVQFGLSSLFILVSFIGGTVRALIISKEKIGVFLAIVYIGLTSISLSLLNSQRIFYFAAILFFISVISVESKSRKDKNLNLDEGGVCYDANSIPSVELQRRQGNN